MAAGVVAGPPSLPPALATRTRTAPPRLDLHLPFFPLLLLGAGWLCHRHERLHRADGSHWQSLHRCVRAAAAAHAAAVASLDVAALGARCGHSAGVGGSARSERPGAPALGERFPRRSGPAALRSLRASNVRCRQGPAAPTAARCWWPSRRNSGVAQGGVLPRWRAEVIGITAACHSCFAEIASRNAYV
eukprot:COSAG01_NODE_1362_length_10565_cov_111.342156_3_plen_189_part_00